MYQIGFIIEQALGHKTHGQNLQKLIPLDEHVTAYWGLPEWKKDRLSTSIPIYKSNWTLQAGLQARHLASQMIRKRKLDVLFFHTQVTAVLSPDLLNKIPTIISLDATPKQYDSLGEYYDHESGPEWLEQWKWRLNRTCFRRARHVVTWSYWAKEGLVTEYDVNPDKISVIPPGVETEAWSFSGRDYFHNRPIKILFVGGNLERKGGLLLLEAFRQLRRTLLESAPFTGYSQQDSGPIELHLVTRDWIPEEPDVFVHNDMQPNSPALKQLYFQSDVFCLPTFGDCLPMVLSEAGAAGLPTISTDVAAIPEIVQDGRTGYLIKVGDKVGLKDKLYRLITDAELRSSLGKHASAKVRESFDAHQNASRLLELMKQTADSAYD